MNKLAYYWKKVRLRGWEGICAYVRCEYGRWRTRRYFAKNLARHADTVPVPGVTIIGWFTGTDSPSKTQRDFVLQLKDAGIPFQAGFRTDEQDAAGTGVTELLTSRKDFNLRKYTHVIEMFDGALPTGMVPNYYHLAFWEFESGFPEVYPKLMHDTGLLAMSDFNFDYWKGIAPSSVDVRKILYPLRIREGDIPDSGEMRRKFGVPEKAFAVFFNFDFGSSYHRKNPYGVVRAFAAAFRDDPDAFLVFKTMRSGRFPGRVSELEQLAEECGVADRFRMIHDYLSDRDLFGLTHACDVYVSLHRGEGFGLGIAEAMAMGKPVVVTDYSSSREFCKVDNSIPVPYRMVAVEKEQVDTSYYSYVREWADADIPKAAEALVRLRDEPELGRKLGAAARDFIRNYFSLDNFRRSVIEFLAPP